MELVKDRAALLQENERLWKELEQTKVALAVESTLRSNLLSGTAASAFQQQTFNSSKAGNRLNNN